jgi:hypothetical protein
MNAEGRLEDNGQHDKNGYDDKHLEHESARLICRLLATEETDQVADTKQPKK